MKDEISALRVYVENNGWQPIATAPNDSRLIDLWAGGKRHVNCYLAKTGLWNSDDVQYGGPLAINPSEVTHWKPITEPVTL